LQRLVLRHAIRKIRKKPLSYTPKQAAQLVASDNTISYAAIEGLEAEQYGIVAKKGNTALIEKVNAALAELLKKDADGKDQIEKWFVEHSAQAE